MTPIRSILAGAAVTTAAILTLVPAARAEDTLVERLASGKAKFEELCSTCHTIDKPLSKDRPWEEWFPILFEMVGRGARISPDDRDLIIDYLGARYTFASKCTVCHTKEKVFDPEKKLVAWKETVAKMAEKQPELFSEKEVETVVAYLELILGRPPEYMAK